LIGVLDPCTPLREDLKQDSEWNESNNRVYQE
jgi:hypothetical protein